MKQEKILDKFNNIKGAMTFLIVLGSFFVFFNNNIKMEYLLKAINCFSIPVLVFTVGYFSKNIEKHNYLKLIIGYLIGNTILMIYSYFINNEAFNLIVPYYSFWFIISLICWNSIAKKLENIKGLWLLSIILSLLVGFFSEINNTLSLSNTICYMPFFILGYRFSYFLNNNDLNSKKNIVKIILGILSFLIGIIMLLIFNLKFTLNDTLMSYYLNNRAVINRMLIIIINIFLIFAAVILAPKKKMPFISKWGENYIYIILYSSIFVLIITNIVPNIQKNIYYLSVSLISTLLICFIFGSNRIKNITNKLGQKISDVFVSNTGKNIILKAVIILIFVCILSIPTIKEIIDNKNNQNYIYDKITLKEQKELDDSISILFAGDLILLKNQIAGAYNLNTNQYDFNPMFEYTKKYISGADLSIGVFEGVMAGEDKGYTNTSLEDMSDDIFVNYPDEFGTAIKDAGFDLVTLSNNHLLDKGKDGAYRTAEVLNNIGLDYTGIYKNTRNNIKLIEVQGLKIGILSYTYGLAYHDDKEAIDENITPILVNKYSKYFNSVKKEVENDFVKIKKQNPDVIIVLPHMGTQFTDKIDDFQKTWNKIFVENGATVILGDHSHHVQPIEYQTNKNGEDVLIVNSPGNFVNSFTRYNGDATAMVEVYLNKETAKVTGCSIIPMWTYSPLEGNFVALPINDILKNDELRTKVSTQDFERIEEVYSLITKTMLNKELPISNMEEKLYYSKDGYKRNNVSPLAITDEEKNSELYKLIENSNSVMFIGDSITEGTINGGYGWYEPLMSNFSNKKVYNISEGSFTVKLITNKYNKETADLYVIAIGTNDIRYRDDKICAMNENDYIEAVKDLINKVPNKNEANFVFIAPWMSTSEDTIMKSQTLKDELIDNYSKKLSDFCLDNNYLYINPNNIIKATLEKEDFSKYLVDYIHPNSNKGIYLYSRAVLDASKQINNY